MKFGINQIKFDEIGNWSKSFKTFIYSAFVIFLMLLFFLLDASEKWAEFEKSQTMEIQLKNTLIEQYKTAVSLNAYRTQLQEIKKIAKNSLDPLAENNRIADLIEELSKASELSGLKLITLKPQQEINQDYYTILPIQASLIGNYDQMGYFFSKLTELNNIFIVSNFTIKREKTDPDNIDSEHLIMTMQLNSYRFNSDALTSLPVLRKA